MPSVVQFSVPRRVELVEAPVEQVGPGEIRVRTWYSGVSTGTELTAYRGSNPYLSKTWDDLSRLFINGEPTFTFPVQGWGYSEVGEVLEVADDVVAVAPGDVIAGVWGHRSEGVISADVPNWLRLPDDLDPVHGVFARVGAIALNAVLAADMQVTERVAVFGQGVIGLLATQLARLSGADVVAIDAMPERLRIAEQLGARWTVPAGVDGGAGAMVRTVLGNEGVDTAIELSGSYAALHEAIRCVGVDGTVVASGFYQGDAVGLRLGEEFHHNRVRIVSSQIGGTPVPLGPRWSQRRLMTAFFTLLTEGRVDVQPLVTDVVHAADVSSAFELLDEGSPRTLQVVLRFDPPAGEHLV
jgi:2-desacetyl-2-hydroxyethyl bacteriochlorophyllide A dehydrogenase